MGKFAVPSTWEKSGDTIKFKTIKGNLGAPATAANDKTKKKKNKKKSKKAAENTGKGPLAPPPSPPEVKLSKVKTGRIEKKKNAKKQKQQKLQLTPALTQAAAESIMETDSISAATTPTSTFEAKLKEQLMGGRFRFLNEQLYTMDSKKANALFAEDRDAFGAYHAGYRHQVERWPLNPLERIAKMLRRMPNSLEIGDFGCGEGKLAQSIPHKVYSMDLVSLRDDIIACDMAATPLTTQSLDVAVYCLSLMGTNLRDYLLEANRVLKLGGFVYVAEIQSRFGNPQGGKGATDDIRAFVRCMDAAGFELIKKDVNIKLFCFFQFKKVRNVGKVALLPDFTFKPCVYRKR